MNHSNREKEKISNSERVRDRNSIIKANVAPLAQTDSRVNVAW